MKYVFGTMIFLLFLLPSFVLSEINVSIELGLGNLGGIYVSYELAKGHSLGVGSGYLFYSDDEEDLEMSIVSPALFYQAEVASLFLLRMRAGVDYELLDGSFNQVSYTFSPDFLVKFFNCFYTGVSVPVIVGTEGVEVVTTIGLGAQLSF